jgi:hypothetical protein
MNVAAKPVTLLLIFHVILHAMSLAVLNVHGNNKCGALDHVVLAPVVQDETCQQQYLPH